MRSTIKNLRMKTQLCKLRVILRPRVTGGGPSRSIQIGDHPANARANRTKTVNLLLRTEIV